MDETAHIFGIYLLKIYLIDRNVKVKIMEKIAKSVHPTVHVSILMQQIVKKPEGALCHLD